MLRFVNWFPVRIYDDMNDDDDDDDGMMQDPKGCSLMPDEPKIEVRGRKWV